MNMPRLFVAVIALVCASYSQAALQLEWEQILQVPGTDTWNKVAVDEDGSIYVIGNLNKLSENKGTPDIGLHKYDTYGQLVWEAAIAGPSQLADLGFDLAVNDGSVFIACQLDNAFNVSRHDAATGAWGWSMRYTGGTARALEVRDGYVYATGRRGAAWFTVKLDFNANAVWTKTIDTPAQDYGGDVAPDEFGNCYAIGKVGDGTDFQCITVKLASANGSELWRSSSTYKRQDALPVAVKYIPNRGVYSFWGSKIFNRWGYFVQRFDPVNLFEYGWSENPDLYSINLGNVVAAPDGRPYFGIQIGAGAAGFFPEARTYFMAENHYPASIDFLRSSVTNDPATPGLIAIDSMKGVHLTARLNGGLSVRSNRMEPGRSYNGPIFGYPSPTVATPTDIITDANDNVIIVGYTGTDALILKLVQVPTAVDDVFESNFNTNLSGTVEGNDMGHKGCSYTLTQQPSNGLMTLNPDGTFLYRPAAGFTGVDHMVYELARAGASDHGVIAVFIHPELKSLTVPADVIGGHPFSLTVALNGAGIAQGTEVALSTNSGSIQVPASVTFPTGSSSQNVSGTTSPVTAAASRTVSATFRGVTKVASLRLLPGLLTGLSISPADILGGNTAIGTITLNAVTGTGTTITITDDSSAITTPASVAVPSGSSSAQFQIATTAVRSVAVRTVRATQGSSVTKQVSMTLRPAPGLQSLTFNPNPVKGGQSSTGTLTLASPAPGGGLSVALTDNTTAINTPTSVSFPAGAVSRTFTITTTPVTAQAVRQVTATLAGSTITANVTLTP